MTDYDSTARSITPAFNDGADLEREITFCTAFLWIPILLVLLNRTDWFPSLVIAIISPLNLAFEALGFGGGLVHDKVLPIAFMLVAMTLAHVASVFLGLIMVGAKHGVCGLARSASRQ